MLLELSLFDNGEPSDKKGRPYRDDHMTCHGRAIIVHIIECIKSKLVCFQNFLELCLYVGLMKH